MWGINLRDRKANPQESGGKFALSGVVERRPRTTLTRVSNRQRIGKADIREMF